MKLLVLGGTVYLSKNVAAQALARGHDVTVATRGASGTPPSGVTNVHIDRSRPETLAALAGQDFDAVIDVARFPGHVSAALDALADRVGHWTFVSTCGVYAHQDIPGQTADTAPLLPAAPVDSVDEAEYNRNKVACENLVTERFGDRAFIVRAGLIVGPGDQIDRFGYWPLRIRDGGEVLAPGSPDDVVQWIDVRDLATWLLDGAEAKTAGSHDGIGAPTTRHRFLTDIADALDAECEFTWVSQEFLTAQDIAPWIGEPALGMWLPLPEYAGFLSRDTTSAYDAGLTPRPIGDTARDWLAWYTGLPTRPALAADLPRDIETKTLAAWHASGESSGKDN